MTATAGEITDEAATEDDAILEAPAVLRVIWADPQHMAEHIALWSLRRFGPRAESSVEKLRSKHPDADREELERLVVQRQTIVGMTEGAFVGGPFIALIVLGFCTALLAQAQMVYELAEVAGRDPEDPMRAAELLVLLGAYPSTEDATAVLSTMKHDPHSEGKKLPRGTRWNMLMKMGYLLEVFGPSDPTRTRLRATLGWIGVSGVFLVGLALPLVWVPYMALAMRRSSLRLGDRALTYYAADGTAGAAARATTRTLRVGGIAALARTVLLVVIPIAAAFAALLAGAQITGGSWASAGILLLAVSALATLAWLGYRWWRRRRLHVRAASGS